jgi:hypothetical protein
MSNTVSNLFKHKAEIQDFQMDIHNYPQVTHNFRLVKYWFQSEQIKEKKIRPRCMAS